MSAGTVDGMLVWDADQLGRRLQCHLLRNSISRIPALGHKSLVSEALHQRGPSACDADGVLMISLA
jgi:hypothetical protein